ncbi:MogA/MoaB family molybdenum cofactor biosynthesis protein [Halorussus lipolyticus]|uniref:MogA/MoaB family molybdenum cofactor biosynthesis protein n=1 Tax=Halorussus lipolyticus TaxID=3034024 RepID=UPI0023E75A38|nr:MogA/MoaB family molybdenum cofactor biosynthesis protein [Halorussus sp. DT80]
MVDFQSRDTRRHDEEDDGNQTESHPSEKQPTETETDDAHHDGDDDHADHDHHHHDVDTLGAAVVTISSSRSLSDDPSGDAVVAGLEDAGHKVVSRDLIDDGYDSVQGTIDALVGRDDVDIVVTTGGTGVTPDDVTIEATRQLLDKQLPGFGELFRSLSFEEIGTRVVGTRATAGVADGAVVFCLPGSENAARLGIEEIIVKEAGHLAGLASRGE